MNVRIDWGPSYGFVIMKDDVQTFLQRFPPEVADVRRAVIDQKLREHLGCELASACFYAWCLGPGAAPGVITRGTTTF